MMRSTIILCSLLLVTMIHAGKMEGEVIPTGKSHFDVIIAEGQVHRVDLTGKDFIVVSLHSRSGEGTVYAVDREGTVWWTAIAASGAKGHETPSGVFTIFRKERSYMSHTHPDPFGVNNMDFSLWFTPYGHALHKGNAEALSHGCIHIEDQSAKILFKWADLNKTRVVVTRHNYLPYVCQDLWQNGYRNNSYTPIDVRNCLRRLKKTSFKYRVNFVKIGDHSSNQTDVKGK